MAFSFFFRDGFALESALNFLVPSLVGRSKVRVWDAGCALGQETYTMAIMLAERMGRFGFRNVRIDATDIDPGDAFGKTVISGVYPGKDLERIPSEIFKKYFEPAEAPGRYRVINQLRDRIRFRKHNLLSLEKIGDGYSLVVCKNVLLHLQPEERVKVIEMFHQALGPGGYLLIEQTQEFPAEVAHLFQKSAGNVQFYRRMEN